MLRFISFTIFADIDHSSVFLLGGIVVTRVLTALTTQTEVTATTSSQLHVTVEATSATLVTTVAVFFVLVVEEAFHLLVKLVQLYA